jgi:hypothetical protein
MVATKPTTGEPVATTWGGEVHDVAEQAIGCVASAPSTSTQNSPIGLTAVVEGMSSMLQGGGIVVPQTGIYEVTLQGTASGVTGGMFRFSFFVNGGDASGGGVYTPGTSSNTRFSIPVAHRKLNAGDKVQVGYGLSGGSGTPAMVIERLAVRLVAQDWAT